MMREHLLPAAQRLFHAVADELALARQQAARFPGYAVPLGLLTVVALAASQIYLARRTRRLLDPGLLVATGAAPRQSSGSPSPGRARPRICTPDTPTVWRRWSCWWRHGTTVLMARSDEALTLIARGNGAHFEASYDEAMTMLSGGDTAGLLETALAEATDPAIVEALRAAREETDTWRRSHEQIRTLIDSGDWDTATHLLIGDDVTSTAGVVGRLDEALGDAINRGAERHAREADRAAAALSPVNEGLTALTVVAVLAAFAGFWPRIREYV